MKILFIGDYSNLHTTLARELRRMGHQADVLSNGCEHMNVASDIYISRQKGIKGGIKYLFELFNLLPRLKGYDVVQLINTNFLSLKPPKIKYFYDRIKEQNGKMFLSLAGNDYFFCKACYEGKIFRFSEFKIGNEFTPGHQAKPDHLFGWMSDQNKRLAEYLFEDIDGAMSVLPEYDMAARPYIGEKLHFTNLPIDFSELPPVRPSDNGKVNIFVGIRTGSQNYKGTPFLRDLALDVEKEFPDKVKTEIVSDLSLKEYLERMSRADIVLDQLYSYSPAMNALYAMAMGKVAGSGGQPEYYEYIGNPEVKPVLSLSPLDTDIKERLTNLALNPELIRKLGEESRKLVMRENDSQIVAQRFLSAWNS